MSWIPGFRLLRGLLIIVLALWIQVTYHPFGDVPFVPFIACDGSTEYRQDGGGGVQQIASDAGGLARRATTSPPPSPAVMRDAMVGWVTGLGRLAGTFERAFNGRPYTPPPTTTVGTPAPSSSGATLAARAAASAGWLGDDLTMAVAVAGAESGFDPAAANPSSSARGLWQVMTSVHADKIGGRDILDPYVNAEVAYAIWQEADRTWQPWVVAGSGAYRAWLDEAEAAVASLPGTGVVPAGYTPAVDCEPGVIPVGMPPGVCPAPEARLTTETVRLCRVIVQAFGDMTVYGWGTRPNKTEHDDGRALDFMTGTDGAKGRAIAEYLRANAAELRVMYVIYDWAIWSPARADEGWRAMEDRGGATANHEDHVHVSVLAGGVTA